MKTFILFGTVYVCVMGVFVYWLVKDLKKFNELNKQSDVRQQQFLIRNKVLRMKLIRGNKG